MCRTGDHHAKQNKADSEKFPTFSLICRVWGYMGACGRAGLWEGCDMKEAYVRWDKGTVGEKPETRQQSR